MSTNERINRSIDLFIKWDKTLNFVFTELPSTSLEANDLPTSCSVFDFHSLDSARAQGENAPAGSSKLVQLQRLNSSTLVLGGGPTSSSILTTPTTINGPSISGGALDFGSRGGESGHNSLKSAGLSGVHSGNLSAGAISGAGSSAVSTPATAATGPVAGSAVGGAGVSGAVVGGAGITATTTLTSGSLHPLHFNWVFWFMHRAPGSKILNYESSMKKIATFGSVHVPSVRIPSTVEICLPMLKYHVVCMIS